MIAQEKFCFRDKALKDTTFPLTDYVLAVVRDAEYSKMLSKKSLSRARQQIETAHVDIDALECSPKIAWQVLGKGSDTFLKERAEFLALKKETRQGIPMKKVKELSPTDKTHVYLLAYALYPKISLENVFENIDLNSVIEKWNQSGQKLRILKEALHPVFHRLIGNEGEYFSAIKVRRTSFQEKDLYKFIIGLEGQEQSKKVQEQVLITLLFSLLRISEKDGVIYSESNIEEIPKPAPAKAKKKSVHIEMKDFLVRSNAFQCRNRLHSMQEVDALVDVLDNSNHIKNIKVAAGYCEQCNVYFIMDSVYQRLKSYGIILCRISDGKDYFNKSSSAGMHLSQESLLMQYGYNVSQVRGLSIEQRQKILALIVDNKIMSRNEIIGYLNFFIRQRKAMPKMQNAIKKWEQDKKYVEKYRVGQYRTVKVNGIKNNKKTVRNR